MVVALLFLNLSALQQQWSQAAKLSRFLERKAETLLVAGQLTDEQLQQKLKEPPRIDRMLRDGIAIMQARGLNVFRFDESGPLPSVRGPEEQR